MKKTVRAGLVAVATFAAVATSASTAAAAPSGKAGGAAKVANPAQACAAIPAGLANFGLEPEGFSFSSCVRTVASQVPNVGEGNPYQQCAALEQGQEGPGGFVQVTYPYTFYAQGGPFPALRVNNREQCARALWAYHTIGSYLGGPNQ
jgi:hypothetical protein